MWIAAPTNGLADLTLAKGTWDQTEFIFRSNALPAYLELELGVLDQTTFDQYRSIANAEIARQFLENQAGKVHLFRQRIPVRHAVP